MTQDTISVMHGNMTVNVPRDIFKGNDGRIDETKEKEFRSLMKGRYPWLNDNSLEVIMRNARKEYLRTVDRETDGRSIAMRYASQGKNELAIMHLEDYLKKNPEDIDAWFAMGELLCKVGRVEEGSRAMNKGRSLI